MPDPRTPTAPPSERRSPALLRIALFVAIYALLEWGYTALRGSRFDALFIHWLTVQPAAGLIGWAFPADGVVPAGHSLLWPGGRMSLQAGCDGFEVMTLFIAAMLVADVAWRRGAVGLLLGCIAIWLLNLLRILALYASFRYAPTWFDPVHTVWGPLLLIGLIAALYGLIVWRPARAWLAPVAVSPI